MSRRVRMLITRVVVAVLAVGAWSARASRSAASGAKYEPAEGRVYLGVSRDIGRLDAFDAVAGLTSGEHPAIYDRWTTPVGAAEFRKRVDGNRAFVLSLK